MTPEELAANLEAMGAALTTGLESVLEPLAPVIHQRVNENFDARSSADGTPWLPRRDKLPHPLLEETGALRGAATGTGPGKSVEVADAELVVGVDQSTDGGGIRWAAIHNFGGGNNIPARPYFQIDDNTVDQLADKIAEGLIQKLV